jgi:two-component system, response regulator, stage 0 sporulation protein F
MGTRLTLLYVDDEPINLMLFEEVFTEKYHILTALSAKEGLEQLQLNPQVQVVISDMKMPGMNGVEFIIQAKALFPLIEYFILTGFGITRDIADAVQNKIIRNYFGKPFDADEIERAIDNLTFKH